MALVVNAYCRGPISMGSLDRVSHNGLIDYRAEHALAIRYADQLRVKTPTVDAEAGTLSGGNQQKVALARWLATNPRVLILDEPTQGVDVGSKSEIHSIMMDLAARGMAIVMISSELPEVLGMSDRIVVMHAGRAGGELVTRRSYAGEDSHAGIRSHRMRKRYGRELSVAASILALCVVLAIVAPGYFSGENLADMFLANMPVLLIALGVNMVILAGQIDTFGSIFAVCGIVAGALSKDGDARHRGLPWARWRQVSRWVW